MTISAERVISVYAYGLTGLAAVTVLSPLFVVSLPVLILLIVPTLHWWWVRGDRARAARFAPMTMLVVALLLVASAEASTIWWGTRPQGYDIGGAISATLAISVALTPWVVALVAFELYLGRAPNV